MNIALDLSHAQGLLDQPTLQELRTEGAAHLRNLWEDSSEDRGLKGWLIPMPQDGAYEAMTAKAREVAEDADVFVLVGVGGSNQAARAAIKALSPQGARPRIRYGGNTLSAHYISGLLAELEGQSVHINVIAKNFETLEPGSHFRMLRHRMSKRYDNREMARRVTVTGSKGSRLEEIAGENGYTFLEFPEDVGGRYSVCTPVGLFPMAVAGLDTAALLAGAQDMRQRLLQDGSLAIDYAAFRNCALAGGYNQVLLGFFEPRLAYFSRWWIQLFAESEGKGHKGIFPSAGDYTEDLHSLGQYMQDGRRNLMETFLCVRHEDVILPVPGDRAFHDGFDYLEGKTFGDINRCAQNATIQAHSRGGVPCALLEIDRLNEYTLGGLFYFFMVSCAISGKLLGINPFDQDGVEGYKRAMFHQLGK